MLILSINSGSSSLKYKLYDALHNFKVLKKDKISIGNEFKTRNHTQAFSLMFNFIKKYKINIITHRIVHGGLITQPVIIHKKNLKELERLDSIAPLHNPYQTKIIKLCVKNFEALNLAIFDTTFHTTKPEYANYYPFNLNLQKKYFIKRYGFHGISHNYLMIRASEILKKNKINLIIMHIGNGVSFCTIKNNKSIDNTMGYSPLEGVMMGTRSGSIDPEVVLLLAEKLGIERTKHILNKESGLLGVSTISNDIRILEKNKKKAKLALDMFIYSLKKTLGSCLSLINPDAIIISGGIGENSSYIRKRIFERLEHLNIKINNKKNEKKFHKKDFLKISSRNSIPILVIKTDEELLMAKIGYKLFSKRIMKS